MHQFQATVVDRETIGPAWWRLTISTPNLSPQLRPGQFMLLRCGDLFSCYLRRPIFPQLIEENLLTILLRPHPDLGLAWLSARQIGDRLDLIGPLGTGFNLPASAGNLLLVSDSQTIAPLLGQMEQAIAAGFSITLALEGARAAALYPVSALPPVVEFQAATLDGSLGHHGSVIDLLPRLLRWADLVCAVGSIQLYRALKSQAADIRFGDQSSFLYGLITEMPLACGVGACFACTIETKNGLKLTCIDGPVFDLAKINFGDVG